MLTISQLATYAGVTVRAVRHYHQIGLLPEPERDHSGYRTYDAAAVVRLIRIRTLADAGVPLARVQELLDASPEEFARGVQEIDKELRAEIRRLQGTRKRLARLTAGEHLALPQSVVDYLDRLRGLGVDERYIELERDSWIMLAAQVPHLIDSVIAKKHEELDDPDMVRLYHLLSGALDWPADDPRVVEIADILERLMIRAVEAGEVGADGLDDPFVDLLDTTTVESSPIAERVITLLEERGWKGWTRIERVPADRPNTFSVKWTHEGWATTDLVARLRGSATPTAPAALPCGCRKPVHLTRRGHTRGSARRADRVARPVRWPRKRTAGQPHRWRLAERATGRCRL